MSVDGALAIGIEGIGSEVRLIDVSYTTPDGF